MMRTSAPRAHSSPRALRLLAVLAASLATAGCMGSWAMRGTRLHYNKSLSHTASQEILLNIVRMRYGETPTFFDLPSIVSQSEARMNGNGGQVGPLQGVVAGNFTLRDAPTLTYQPRTGDNLGASMIKALSAAVILDVPPGGDTRTFLLTFVDSINGVRNSPSATSPSSCILESNDDYRYAIELYMALQNRGAVKVRVATRDEKPQGSPLAAKNVATADMLAAADNGYLFQVSGDEAVLVKRSRFAVLTIQQEDAAAAEVEELRRIFGLAPHNLVYRIKSLEDNEIDLNAAAEESSGRSWRSTSRHRRPPTRGSNSYPHRPCPPWTRLMRRACPARDRPTSSRSTSARATRRWRFSRRESTCPRHTCGATRFTCSRGSTAGRSTRGSSRGACSASACRSTVRFTATWRSTTAATGSTSRRTTCSRAPPSTS